MCGIAGTLADDARVRRDAVVRMCDTLEHRGPDSRGVYADARAALGVQRLEVIDPAGGDQPMRNEDGSLVLVANAEIYNHGELRDELAGRGHRFRGRGDVEVILHLYEELGERCVERLHGMFAFALWDSRRRTLLLARDRVGKKPLYYAIDGRRLWFASEPRAILATGEVARDVDPQSIDLYLHYQCVPGTRTAFTAIDKLAPAHTLTWRDGAVSTRRYWRLSYGDAAAGEDETCERIRATLLDATRMRLQSDVPVGALLSGGVDSSAVVAAMARLQSEPVKCFSIGFDVDGFDETDSAREVARLYGCEHTTLELDHTALDSLPRIVWHYGDPFADSSAVATYALARLARGEVTVALNGDGGDESFGGYRRYLRYARGNGRPAYEEYATRRANGYFDAAARADLYQPDFAATVDGERWREVIHDPYRRSDARTPVERLLDVDVQTYLPDDLLVKMDRATMAHSLEARSPLLDEAMMALAAGLPVDMKVNAEATKRIFKRALRAWLPASVVDRQKMGFRVPVGDWMRGPLRDLPGDVLLDPRTLERGLFRPERVEAIVCEHRDAVADHGYRIWTLLMLELWYRTYVDRAEIGEPIALSVPSRPV